jgi:DNA polymerase-3 subunit beta
MLREMLRRTSFACDAESGRYALGGVLLEFADGRLITVATDGRRLAKMEATATLGDVVAAQTIVPERAVKLIGQVLADIDGEAKIAAGVNEVQIQAGDATIYARLVEGRFPKWRDVLPHRSGSAKIDLTAGPLAVALRQAGIVTSQDSCGVQFRFTAGTLSLASQTAEIGEARVELPITYGGEPATITLDVGFCTEFCRTLDAEQAFTLDVADANAAALFTTDDGYAYVVMPLAKK